MATIKLKPKKKMWRRKDKFLDNFILALRCKSHIDARGWGLSLMTFWSSKSYGIWKFMFCNLFIFYLSNHRWKNIYQVKKKSKIYEINQILELRSRVPIPVSSCLTAAHAYWWILWIIHISLVSSFRKNTRVKTKKLRNIK